MVTARFADYVQQDGRSHSMNLRWSFPPYPVGWVSRETLHDYVHGKDPVSGTPLMEEIVSALTQPLTEAELNPTFPPKPQRLRLLEPDTETNLHRLFLENGWTDGLPIVLPTEERVAEMLTGTDHDPQEIVGRMTVTTHEERLAYTVEKVAVNAVMAGARPEHLPVILAIASAEHPSLPSSTGSYGSMVVVNGPVCNAIGMNCGIGAMGPFNYANAVIGRTWTLMTINLGDARLGRTFMATIGNGLSFTNMTCGENEENSPWEAFSLRKGFKTRENTISLFRGWNVKNLGIGSAAAILDSIRGAGMSAGSFSIVLDPLVAKNLVTEGYNDPRKLSEWLADQVDSKFLKPEGINFVVVGGETNPLFVTTDYVYYKTISVDKWIPKDGILRDAQPLRMPAGAICADGSCGLH